MSGRPAEQSLKPMFNTFRLVRLLILQQSIIIVQV